MPASPASPTVHAYTSDQRLLDAPHKDFRRARSAGLNLVPTSTGAAKAIGVVIPELAGRLQGFAVRVPLATGLLVDLTVELEHETSAQAVNLAMRERADRGSLTGILSYSEEPLVSTDVVKSSYSSIFDSGLTLVTGSTQVKIMAWSTTSGATPAALSTSPSACSCRTATRMTPAGEPVQRRVQAGAPALHDAVRGPGDGARSL